MIHLWHTWGKWHYFRRDRTESVFRVRQCFKCGIRQSVWLYGSDLASITPAAETMPERLARERVEHSLAAKS